MKLRAVLRVAFDAGDHEQVRVLSGDRAWQRAQAEQRIRPTPTTEATEHTEPAFSHCASHVGSRTSETAQPPDGRSP